MLADTAPYWYSVWAGDTASCHGIGDCIKVSRIAMMLHHDEVMIVEEDSEINDPTDLHGDMFKCFSKRC